MYDLHFSIFFFFNDTATTEIYTLSLHDALPISPLMGDRTKVPLTDPTVSAKHGTRALVGTTNALIDPTSVHSEDRKSTRLNSSHMSISYAVFCLKKKKKKKNRYKSNKHMNLVDD